MNRLETALAYRAGGISVIPAGLNKISALTGWKEYQRRPPTEAELTEWFGDNDNLQIATICGQVSGDLMVIDFDRPKKGQFEGECAWDAWLESAEAESLLPKIRVNRTPSGGYHLRFRCSEAVGGNSKLAATEDGQVLIETRGEGGYALAPPSTGYQPVGSEDFLELDVLSVLELDWLINSLKRFDRAGLWRKLSDEDLSTKEAESRHGQGDLRDPKGRRFSKTNLSIADRYNQSDDWLGLMTRNGWQIFKEDDTRIHLTRPGKDGGTSATFNKEFRVLTCFSSNAHPLKPFSKRGDGYSPFKLLGTLDFEGDFSAAAKWLIKENPDWSGNGSRVPSATNPERPVEQEVIDDDLLVYEVIGAADAPYDLKKMMPPGSWLERYFQFLSQATDAPDQYILASGLGILGMMFRSCSLDFGITTLRPNIWLALVGRSTMFRKSTILNASKKILNGMECMQLPEQTTPEAFLGILSENELDQAEGFFNWYEMGAVLKNYQKNHMRAMMEILTELYDCPDRYTRATKTEGIQEVEDPFINIMAATTQRWLNDSLTSGDLEGGFLPRFLWVQASKKTRHHPVPKAWDTSIKESIQNDLKLMADRYQNLKFYLEEGSDAYQMYAAFHLRTEQEIARHPEADTVGGFYARLLTYTVKFSMIFHIMLHADQSRPELALSAESMELAIVWADFFKANVDLVTESMAFDPKGADRKKVVGIIAKNPGIARSQLFRQSRMAAKELDEAIDSLVQANLICPREEWAKNSKTTFYYLLKDEEVEL